MRRGVGGAGPTTWDGINNLLLCIPAIRFMAWNAEELEVVGKASRWC